MINNYGADAVRLFILSDSPPEKDVQWSEQGMISSYKFLLKFWNIHQDIIKKIKEKKEGKKANDETLLKFTNQMLQKIDKNLNNFQYNVIIANFHEIHNFLNKEIKKEINHSVLLECYIKIIKVMSPIIPHFAAESLESLNYDEKELSWPNIDKKYLESDKVNIVIQINGKKRSLIIAENNINEKDLIKIITGDPNTEKYLTNKKIKKTIYIKNKLINLII